MTLLEELVNRRAQKAEQYHEYQGVVQKWIGKVADVLGEIEELDCAIAALTPIRSDESGPESETAGSDALGEGEPLGCMEPGGEEPDGDFDSSSGETHYDADAEAQARSDDYPELTDEQLAAIKQATADYQDTTGAEIVSGEPFDDSEAMRAAHTLTPGARWRDWKQDFMPKEPAPEGMVWCSTCNGRGERYIDDGETLVTCWVCSGKRTLYANSPDEAAAYAPVNNPEPLFPPEPPPAATPESLRERGIVDSEASWWARKMIKEPA